MLVNSRPYQKTQFDSEFVKLTPLSRGIVSKVAVLPDFENKNHHHLIVTGLREGGFIYDFEKFENSYPVYGEGKEIPELGNSPGGVSATMIPGTDRLAVFHDCGRKVSICRGNYPDTEAIQLETGIDKLLDFKKFGMPITVHVFKRTDEAPLEMAVGFSDSRNYYPGEKGVYGGRAVGLNQDGRDIGRDENGKWLGGVPVGTIHLFQLEFEGDSVNPKYSGQLSLNGKEIEFSETVGAVAIGDFDGDGRLEAIINAEWGLKIFRISTVTGSTALEKVLPDGNELLMKLDFQLAMVCPVMLLGESRPDLIMGSLSGDIYFMKNSGKNITEFLQPERVQCRDHCLRIGSFAVPALGDLNGNGVLDMLVGVEDGYIYRIMNHGTKEQARWGNAEKLQVYGKTFRVVAGETGSIQGPNEALHGYVCPCLYDWTGNGLPDLITGDITGYYTLYKNVGTKSEAVFAPGIRFRIDGRDFRTVRRVRPAIADIDGDGEPELISLDRQGMISYYKKKKESCTELEDGIRLVDNLGRYIRLDNTSGASGRVKLWAVDWTGNGTIDIIIGTYFDSFMPMYKAGSPQGRATFLILENRGTKQNPHFIVKPLLYNDDSLIDLGHHSCAPAVVDINGDGQLEILAGTETGIIYYFPREEMA